MAIVALIFGSMLGLLSVGFVWATVGMTFLSALAIYFGVALGSATFLITARFWVPRQTTRSISQVT